MLKVPVTQEEHPTFNIQRPTSNKSKTENLALAELLSPERASLNSVGQRPTADDNENLKPCKGDIAKKLEFRYRSCTNLDNDILLSVTFQLEQSTSNLIRQKRLEYRQKRFDFSGLRTAGSVFKNPAGQSAGKLLDDTGFKGMRIGGAFVCDRHANIISTENGATASDVLALVQLMKQKVPVLEREIKII